MKIKILTPSSTLYIGEVNLVRAPGSDGLFELLSNHAPIISSLKKGIVKLIDLTDTSIYFSISGGVLECQKNEVVILTESGQQELADY